MASLRIGLVLDDTLDKPDGVQQYVLTIGKWLHAQGHTVHYLVANTTRTDIPNLHSLGRYASLHFNHNTVRTPLPASRTEIRHLLGRLKLDVLHIQMPYSPWLAGRIIQEASPQTAIVGTFHILPASRWHGASNTVLARWLRPTLKRFKEVAAVSAPAAAFARQHYGLTAEVIPNPIDVQTFASAAVTEATHPRALHIVFMGRLVQRKGATQLIRAFNALPEDLARGTVLTIGGSGPQEQRLRQLTGSNPAITFTGFIPEAEKPAFLARADLAVFPAISGESFGIVLIEAMAAGAGVVLGGNNPGYTSVLGSLPESLFTPQNVSDLSQKLIHFLRDTPARQALHQKQQILVKQFDIHKVGPRLEAMYRRSLQ